MMERLTLLLALALLPLSRAMADNPDFTGAWVGSLCPSGVDSKSGKCSSFVLELHQKDGRVCGAHMVANADASEVDEGDAPSIFGDVADAKASVVAVSSRASPPVRVHAELTRTGATLRWRRIDDADGGDLLPRSSRLVRSRSKTLFAPVFAQRLNAACASAFFIASQRAAQPAGDTPPKPAE